MTTDMNTQETIDALKEEIKYLRGLLSCAPSQHIPKETIEEWRLLAVREYHRIEEENGVLQSQMEKLAEGRYLPLPDGSYTMQLYYDEHVRAEEWGFSICNEEIELFEYSYGAERSMGMYLIDRYKHRKYAMCEAINGNNWVKYPDTAGTWVASTDKKTGIIMILDNVIDHYEQGKPSHLFVEERGEAPKVVSKEELSKFKWFKIYVPWEVDYGDTRVLSSSV